MDNTRGLSLRQELTDMGFEEEAVRRFVRQYGVLVGRGIGTSIQQFTKRIKEKNVTAIGSFEGTVAA